MTVSQYSPFMPPGTGEKAAEAAEIRPVLMTITPEIAAEWAERNTHNRSVRYSMVAQFARDMAGGRWDVNGETIKIASDGTLLDGQHRIYACIQAKVPFTSFVVEGLPPETQRTMDTGVRRKVSDLLALNGEKEAVLLAAITKWALLWLRGSRGRGGGTTDPTHQEMIEFLEATPRLREATEFAANARKEFRSVRGSVWGMAWLLLDGINDIAARVFFERILDGANISVGHPAHTFRARIWRAREHGERLTEHEQLALMILAWNAFRDERQLSILKLPSGRLNQKSFPVPK